MGPNNQAFITNYFPGVSHNLGYKGRQTSMNYALALVLKFGVENCGHKKSGHSDEWDGHAWLRAPSLIMDHVWVYTIGS